MAQQVQAQSAEAFHVKLFGPLARLAKTSEATVAISSGAPTVAALRAALSVKFPTIADALTSCRIAVNQAFAQEQQAVSPGDELAVIGMVSGG